VLLRLAALALVAVVAAGCGGGTKSSVPTTTTNNLPPGCTADEVDSIITSFLSHPRLAPTAMFQVYATYESDGGKYVTRKRAAALAHLRARRAAGEKLRLIQLRVSPQDVNHVRVTFEVTRFAPDFAARKLHGRIANGAGTIDCAHQQVAAWLVRGP
jgi:hypothetical protein